MNLQIRKATLDDLDRLMEIFEEARRFMCRTGNPNQWINGYPQRELIQEEIEASHCYVCVTEDGRAVATFCFIQGPGFCKGIGKLCVDWCFRQWPCLRADTHADNKVMQHLLLSTGFVYCGIIYVRNGTPRLAYQKLA